MLFPPSFLKDHFSGYKILGWKYLFASVCCVKGPLEQQQATSSFLFLGPQASRVCHILSALQGRWDRNQSPQEAPRKVRMTAGPTFPLKERLPGWIGLGQLSHGSSGAAAHWLALVCSSCLEYAMWSVTRHLEVAIAHQHSETGGTEGSPSGSPPTQSAR